MQKTPERTASTPSSSVREVPTLCRFSDSAVALPCVQAAQENARGDEGVAEGAVGLDASAVLRYLSMTLMWGLDASAVLRFLSMTRMRGLDASGVLRYLSMTLIWGLDASAVLRYLSMTLR
jgi:hypothetical protein